MKQRSINITEIAKIAKVHPSTVSRALNGSSLVKPETREWIEAIAKEHGYIADAVAKSLCQGRTLTLGVIVPEISNSFYSHILDEIEAGMGAKGYSIIISSTGFDLKRERQAINTMVGKRVDALVVCAPSHEAEAFLVPLSEQLPVILCDTTHKGSLLDSVYVDECAGVMEAVQYLKAQGVTKIGFLSDNITLRRANIFRETMRKCGLPVDERFVYCGTGTSAESGYHGIYALSHRDNIPEAICTARDNIAIGAMRAANELNINIPQQLSIIGYDDISIASYMQRKLTTIRQPASEIGKNVSHLLTKRLLMKSEHSDVSEVILTPNLILRETTMAINYTQK